MIEKLTKLINVKSIVTLVLTFTLSPLYSDCSNTNHQLRQPLFKILYTIF